jgi:hypothetical protein
VTDLHKNTWRQCAAGIRPIGEPLPPVDNFLIAELEHAQKGPRLLKTITVSILFTALMILISWAIIGCGKVRAQSSWGDFTGMGKQGDPCKAGKYPGHIRVHEHWQMLIIACEPDDGKPPRFIPKGDSTICEAETLSQCPADHWECDKGFQLDGAIITWEHGIANIQPERCKAVPQ